MDRIEAMKIFIAALDEGSLAGASRRTDQGAQPDRESHNRHSSQGRDARRQHQGHRRDAHPDRTMR